ncbi:unnamed protein product [Dovyalis caffra]|uniref:Uncharacterized protein n=1 Tax=Dovyalis caffra TaxID=77055 RepID=A0AAV1QNC6_9ROSI|nr:unnamed protein product [Dovyalis caffra]
MEYATTAAAATYPQMHQTQNQNPNPNPPQQQQQPISTSLYSSYYYPPAPPLPAADPQNQPITTQFYATDPITTLTPPGVDSYTTYPHLAYYFDPNSHTWAAKEAVRQYGSDPATFPIPVREKSRKPRLENYSHLLKVMLVEALESLADCLFVDPRLRVCFRSDFVMEYSMHVKVVYCKGPFNSITFNAKVAKELHVADVVTLPSIPITPNGTEQLAIAHPDPTSWANLTFQAQGNSNWKKHPKKTLQKKTKVSQSAYCEVCKVDCNSKDVLDQHKLGKKHKKNVEKLQAAAAGYSVSAGSSNLVTGRQENPSKSENRNVQTSKKKASELLEDLDTKRRKILEGGAAAEAVRACSICNVVCNSETVFNSHLAGQKHAAMLKKLAAGIRVATAT